MTSRDFHPGDIILVYGDIKVVERVDRTHLATRGTNDSLELWSYQGEIETIHIKNNFVMKSLGFYKEDGLLKFDIEYGAITIDPISCKCKIPYSKDGYEAEKIVETINDVQQFYFHITGEELNFDV